LGRYEKRRKFDNGNMVLMTDALDRFFSNAIPPLQAARRFGLGMVQNMPRLRRFFMRTAMGQMRRA
jgi:2-octaprenyl-6-methoxyphenol hydroxylase